MPLVPNLVQVAADMGPGRLRSELCERTWVNAAMGQRLTFRASHAGLGDEFGDEFTSPN